MDSTTSICLSRSDNELMLAKAIQHLSEDSKIKKDIFSIPQDITFYSAVIAHAYYAIFYSAKSYLIFKKENLPLQGQHSAVYHKFKRYVKNGEITKDLLSLYDDAMVKAEVLLQILDDEEQNRTQYTYQKLPQANKEPAQNSITNAQFFVSHIKVLIQQKGEE